MLNLSLKCDCKRFATLQMLQLHQQFQDFGVMDDNNVPEVADLSKLRQMHQKCDECHKGVGNAIIKKVFKYALLDTGQPLFAQIKTSF